MDDIISGVDTTFDVEEPLVNMELLFQYCAGKVDFPINDLLASQASVDAIDLVKSLLVANPKERATATGALQSPWLTSIKYKNDWFTRLEEDFAMIAVDLDIGTRQDPALMRQIRTVDVARFLPTSAANNLPLLLEQAIHKQLHNAAWMLVHSAGRIVRDPLGVQRMFDHAVRERNRRSVNRAGSDGRTAVEVAVDSGWHDILAVLLANKARVDTAAEQSYGGRTAFQVAAASGFEDVLRLLVKDQERINSLIRETVHAQTMAPAGQVWVKKTVRQRFLSNEANINANINAGPANESGRTALQAAAENGHLDLVKILVATGAAINAPHAPISGRTALQAAAESGHLDIVGFLLGKGANVNAHAGRHAGVTALYTAARSGYTEIVKLLLDNDADVNYVQQNRNSLQRAAAEGHIEVVRLLAHNTTIVDRASGYRGRTALQAAAENGHVDVMTFLVANNFAIDAPPCDQFGRTALQAAAERGHLEVAKFLVENGANVNAGRANVGGKTALRAATDEGHSAMVQFLQANGASSIDSKTVVTKVKDSFDGLLGPTVAAIVTFSFLVRILFTVTIGFPIYIIIHWNSL